MKLQLASIIAIVLPFSQIAAGSPDRYIDPLAPSDGSDATAAINSAIDAANAAGGGVVYLPKGTYTIQGDGKPSDGAILLKSHVCLEGDGPGATILLLRNNMGADITGLVRTPTATSVSDLCLRNLTIDGNKTHNGGNTIIGFYAGVNPSLGVSTISVEEGKATVTTAAVHRRSVGDTVYLFNTSQSALTGDFVIQSVPSTTTFIIGVASGTSSEFKSPASIWYYPTALADAYVYDVLIENVEIRNCTDYGFDPHERMKRLVILNSSAHDNDKDGFVADYIENGAFINDHAYNNGRHGFNVTTATNNFSLLNCAADNNGALQPGNGAVIQRGSGNFPIPNLIDITGGAYNRNARNGILVQMGEHVTISRLNARENGWAGIHMFGAQFSTVVGNVVGDNSQAKDNAKDEIYIQAYDDTAGASGVKYSSTDNVILQNCIASTLANRARYSIEEADDSSDRNTFLGNTAFGAAIGNYITHGPSTIVSAPLMSKDPPRCAPTETAGGRKI